MNLEKLSSTVVVGLDKTKNAVPLDIGLSHCVALTSKYEHLEQMRKVTELFPVILKNIISILRVKILFVTLAFTCSLLLGVRELFYFKINKLKQINYNIYNYLHSFQLTRKLMHFVVLLPAYWIEVAQGAEFVCRIIS
jgi:hypothetical protein